MICNLGEDSCMPLHLAAGTGHLETVEMLIAKGAQVNGSAINNGWTPLFSAIAKKRTSIAKYLIAKRRVS